MQSTNTNSTHSQKSGEDEKSLTTRKFRILLVVMLVLLSIQGWLGDTVNIFYSPPNGLTSPPFTFGGFLSAMEAIPAPFFILYHAFQGMCLVALAAAVFALSFKWSKARSVKITSGLGFASVLSAAIGGFLFVMSGFSNGGNSAQMGGSFIGAYALFFLTLFYAK